MSIAESYNGLADHLYGDLDTPTEDDGAWSPDDDRAADRLLGRRERVLRELADAEEMAAAEVEQIAIWLAGQKEKFQPEADRLEEILKRYHAVALAKDKTRKTIKLVNGTLKSSEQTKPSIEWTDDEALLAWLQVEHPELVRENPVTYAPKKDEAKKIFVVKASDVGLLVMDADGQLVPGVVAHPPKTTYKVDQAGRS